MANVGQMKDQSAFLIQQNLNSQLNARRQMLMNPAISGYSEAQLSRALDFAFGSSTDFYSTLGGVGIENLGLVGIPGINNESTENILRQGDRLVQIGMAMGGPNSLAAQLAQKAQLAQMKESQQNALRYQQNQYQIQYQKNFFDQQSQQLQIEMEKFSASLKEKQLSGEPITMQDMSMGMGMMQMYIQLTTQYQQSQQLLQQQLQGGNTYSSGILNSIMAGSSPFGNSSLSGFGTGFGSSGLFGSSPFGSSPTTGFGII